MTMTLAAVQAAVYAANSAGKQVTVTTADYTFSGTARYADSDHRRLVVFTQAAGGYGGETDGERLVDANGAAFRIGETPAIGGSNPYGGVIDHNVAHGDTAYDWDTGTAHPLSDHPKPWTRHTQASGYTNASAPLTAVFVDVKDIVSLTTASSSADTTLGTTLVSTTAGTHRERDAGWLFGNGLEPATT